MRIRRWPRRSSSSPSPLLRMSTGSVVVLAKSETRKARSMMPPTQLEAIAQAVAQRQSRYQRDTLLFGLLARLLLQGQPVAPERLARMLHRNLDEVRPILRAHPELEYDEHGHLVGSGLTLVPTTHQFQ